MPRRARHEARERLHERRRDIRKRFFEEFRKAFITKIRDRFRSSLMRHIEEWEEFKERVSLLLDIIRGRAKAVFVQRHIMFPTRVREYYQYDKFLMDMPEDLRNTVINVLRQISARKYIDPRVIERYPWIKYFLWAFVAYYSKYPCTHMAYIIKLTPVTINFFGGLRITYYVIRWAYARDVKADPYIGRSRTVDIYVSFFRWKYDEDLINFMEVCDEGIGDWNDTVPLSRDAFRNPEYSIPLRRAILQPHWVRQALAKMIGKPEVFTVVGHCSIYGMLERPSKTLQLIKTGYRRIMGERPRHRIKEILYRTGLRI